MSGFNQGASGGFLPTARETLRYGLGSTHPDSWQDRAQDGLKEALPVFQFPELAPQFYSNLADRSLALALAGSVYSQGESGKVKKFSGAEYDARLQTLGFNILACALVNAPEPAIQAGLRDAEPSAIERHLPAATALMSWPREERDQVLESLHGDLPLRGMFLGISGVWQDAVGATQDRNRLAELSGLKWRKRAAVEKEDTNRGIVIAKGYVTLLAATAMELGYISELGVDLAPQTGPGASEREVIYLPSTMPQPPEAKQQPVRQATPSDMHNHVQKSRAELGIDIPTARELAITDNQQTMENLASLEVLDGLRERIVAKRVKYISSKELDTLQGTVAGVDVMAVAIGSSTSAEFIDTIESLSLLPTVRTPKKLDKIIDIASDDAMETVNYIWANNRDLREASKFLGLGAPLLESMREAINIDAGNYASPSKQPERYFAYLESAYATLRVFSLLLKEIPDPTDDERKQSAA